MNTQLAAQNKTGGRNPLDIAPFTRSIVAIAATAMSLACFYALVRLALGIAPSHPNLREIAIVIHVATVVPSIPLGGYLLLTRKGTALHKQLGKIWVGMMVVTALSAIFIKTGGSFSFIHLFIPLTLFASWQVISTARAGKIAAHKKHILGMYLGALMIPGILAFALPSRLMNVLVFGW